MAFANENVAADTATTGQATQDSGVAQATTKKASRRGVSSARGTTRLKFSHEQAHNNGLFTGHLDSVEVRNMNVDDNNTNMPSFNGLEVPRLVFTFASNEDKPTDRRYVTLSFTAVESNAETIPGKAQEWKVNQVFDWLKHIFNVFVLKGREFTEEEEEMLSLGYEDFDEQGEYAPVDPEVVIAEWRKLFNNVVTLLNRENVENGTPAYKTKDGKFIRIWMKLIRYQKSNKQWKAVAREELAFPAFIGEGCIEEYKPNTLPKIRLNVLKESITPMKLETPKQPNFAGAPGGMSAAGGVPIADPMAGNMPSAFGNGVSAEAGEDMPF